MVPSHHNLALPGEADNRWEGTHPTASVHNVPVGFQKLHGIILPGESSSNTTDSIYEQGHVQHIRWTKLDLKRQVMFGIGKKSQSLKAKMLAFELFCQCLICTFVSVKVYQCSANVSDKVWHTSIHKNHSPWEALKYCQEALKLHGRGWSPVHGFPSFGIQEFGNSIYR